ncbi:hypothetical protein ABIC44_001395 [Sphingomonas sp. 1185]
MTPGPVTRIMVMGPPGSGRRRSSGCWPIWGEWTGVAFDFAQAERLLEQGLFPLFRSA